MPFGLLTGLCAALSWGTLDVITALASRVIGSLRVTAGMQFASALIFLALALISGTRLPTDPGSFAMAALLGFIGAGAYLAYFTGLQYGPISVVSGVVAAFGGLTVVLSVVFRGESLTTLHAAGATIATIGVVLTGIAFEGGWRATRFAGPGVVFSIVALVLFALMTMVTDIALETMEWLQVYALARGINAATSIAVVVVLARTAGGRGRRPVGGPAWSDARIVVAIVVAAVLDVLGLIAFAIGLESAPTWMVGLAASFGPAVTILAAVAFLGERLKPIQWVGLAGVATGMIAIGLPSG
jgi:drug/metabolite transporter (DMT)-like permease